MFDGDDGGRLTPHSRKVVRRSCVVEYVWGMEKVSKGCWLPHSYETDLELVLLDRLQHRPKQIDNQISSICPSAYPTLDAYPATLPPRLPLEPLPLPLVPLADPLDRGSPSP